MREKGEISHTQRVASPPPPARQVAAAWHTLGRAHSQAFPNIIPIFSFSSQINGPLQQTLSLLCSNIFFKAAEETFGLRRAAESRFQG